MPDAHKNFAYSTVATAPSPATSGTSLVVAAGQGALFPAVPFNATIWPTGAQPLSTTAEIVRVTARATDTLTITRAQESSSARTVVVGDQIAATVTAKTLTDVETESVAKALFDANTVLAANADDTPLALTMGASTILARLAAGNIKAASVAEIATLLAPDLPGYQLGIIERTGSNYTTTQTVQASATTALTMASITFDGATLIEFSLSCLALNSVAQTATIFNLWEDSTDLGAISRYEPGRSTTFENGMIYGRIQRTPSAGAKVYTIRGWVNGASTGTMFLGNGTTIPPTMFTIKRA